MDTLLVAGLLIGPTRQAPPVARDRVLVCLETALVVLIISGTEHVI
jgi:hypothetical protein